MYIHISVYTGYIHIHIYIYKISFLPLHNYLLRFKIFAYGSVILPFVDRFPKDTELYRIMTTKPQEQEAKE